MKNSSLNFEAFCKIPSQKGQAVPIFIVAVTTLLAVFILSIPKLPAQYIIFSVLGVILSLLVFLKTNLALGLLIFSMLLSPQLGVGQVADRTVVVRFDDIFLMAICVGWMAKLAVFKELGLLKKTALNASIFGYIFVCAVSTAVMLIQGQGSIARSFFYFIKYFEYFLLYFLVVNSVENMHQVKVFVFLMILTCFLVSLYGLYSYFAIGVRATAPFQGLEGEANTLAGYLVLMISIILGILIYVDSMRLKMGLFVVLAVALTTLVYTLSRGGWLSFVIMYLVFIFLTKRRRAILVAILVTTILLAPALAPKVAKERLASTFVQGGKTYKIGSRSVVIDESGAARIDSWKVGLKKLAENPILGHGIPGASVVDNQYTRIMIEVGFAGLIAFFFLLAGIFKMIRAAIIATRDDPFAQGLSIGFMAGFFGILIHAFSAATFIIIRIMEPFWFLLALIVLLPKFFGSQAEREVSVQGT